MNYTDFAHPDDLTTLRQLENIPAFPVLMKKMMEYGGEMFQRIENLSYYIRLSERQMPETYALLVSISNKMGIPVPEFYMDSSDYINAFTVGDTKPCIVITKKLFQEFSSEEVEAVIAHECGHILCKHMLYSSLADFLFTATDEMINSLGIFGSIGSTALSPLKYALMAWSRASELSADRASCIVSKPETIVKVLALLQFPRKIVEQMNLAEWASQAAELERMRSESRWNNLIQKWNNSDNTHPYNVIRAYEITKWEATDQYKKIKNHIMLLESPDQCPSCGKPVVSDWAFCKSCGAKL